LFRPEHIEEITSRSREELAADSRRPCGKRSSTGSVQKRASLGYAAFNVEQIDGLTSLSPTGRQPS
jgi:hypothetical protein